MRLALFFCMLFLASCGPAKGDRSFGKSKENVDIELPSRDSFDAEQIKLLNGFFLTIETTESGETDSDDCSDVPPKYVVDTWRNEPISEPLLINCVYRITLDLGKLDNNATSLETVYFTNRERDGKGQQISDAKEVLQLTLRVTQDGKDAGFSGSTDIVVGCEDEEENEEEEEDDLIDWSDVNTPPDTDPSPDDTLPPLQLTADQDVALTDGTTTFSLSDYFESEYLVIDISSTSCPYCIDLAKEHQNDSDFDAVFSTKKCRFLTVVKEDELSSWLNIIGDGYVSDRSFGISGRASALATKFGVTASAIPFFFVIDRNGNVVTDKVGAIPAEVANLCQ